jgi:hypothetical protein
VLFGVLNGKAIGLAIVPFTKHFLILPLIHPAKKAVLFGPTAAPSERQKGL